MPRKLPAPPIGSADDAEAEFYDALQSGDLERLMAVWSDDDDICCVHPGGARLIGATAIRASFAALFGHGPVGAMPGQVRRVETPSTSVHTVVERVPVAAGGSVRDAIVVATNVYVKGPRGWKLVVHHASPGSAAQGAAEGEAEFVASPGSTLH